MTQVFAARPALRPCTRAIGHIRYDTEWIARHIHGLPRPMNRARAMPLQVTSTMMYPESWPRPMKSVFVGVMNGMKMSMIRMWDSTVLVQRWNASDEIAITPVVRWVDCRKTRCLMERTRRSVETSPTMMVIESDTRVRTPM